MKKQKGQLSPIQPKTKEQIAREMEVKRKRAIVVNKYWPALTKATISVDEARMLVSVTSSFIMEAVMESMKTRKFSEIKEQVFKKLCPDGERKEEIAALLDVFDQESLLVSREIIEGAKAVIDQILIDESRKRTLESFLPVDWGRMLN